MEINSLMFKVNDWIKKILKDKYVGVYFHGSLRLGSFNPNKSDLDFIIVVNNKLSEEEKKSICDKMMENKNMFPKKGFEFSVVLEKYCNEFIYPTPYELHMSETWEEIYINNPSLVINDEYKTDKDLASHFNVINVTNNEMDFGKNSKEVFSVVSKNYVLDSNFSDIENSEEEIVKNPIYVILNLCRFYAYVKDNITLSKYDGGKWALDNLNNWNHNIIEKAMKNYINDYEISFNNEELYNFANTAMKDIFNLLNINQVCDLKTIKKF